MNSLMIAALSLSEAAAGPPAGPTLERGLITYRSVAAGQTQLPDLTPQERLNLLELQRWLGARPGIEPSETKAQCMDRLSSQTPTRLELELLDLKCSQRPDGDGDR
jgi:hypothetical protein